MKFMKTRSFIITLLLSFAVLGSGCVTLEQNPVSGNKRAFGYSWEEEEKLGANADKEIVAQYGLYQNEELSNYVSDLGQSLLEVSHLRREDTPKKFRETEFTFRVLDSPVVNAFALPGGYIYVTRGLLAHLNNEAQLAVVLGHEIGHVAARHASQRAVEQQIGQIAIMGGAVLGESLGYDGGSILQLSSQTAQLMFLKYGRDDERESDALGVEYSAMKNYKAAEGAEFFNSLERISESQGGGVPTLLSSHPDPGEREKTIPELAQKWEERGYEQTILDDEEFLNMIEGMVFGNNPRHGFERKGTFYHPDLKFQFPVPAGLQVYNQPAAVIMVNEEQTAITQFTIDSESNSAESYVNSFLNREGITTVDQYQYTENGLDGYQAFATALAQDSTELRIQITAIEFQGNIYNFLSYTSASDFPIYEGEFASIPAGFRELNDASILGIDPVRIDLKPAARTAPFAEFLPADLPMDIQPLDVAIINQVKLDETIQQGTILKIPVQ
ncbi:M48 family metalloprotease [Gracilimonas sediminicola]|uniref:M48 family metalloprotease n=1 Tax=Gracilimonas sediminicola TaxID=2952158 RepID=A0A9X2RCG5_9BACT|nr:M48 family metalloprotease [Gracilimonas sediminicola]MCP9289962.1 M48 family metalloprotease [Gracilimonas sediminicola]